jgi:PPP family 3-phenylpropionic acid transporter
MPYWRLSSFYFFYYATLGALVPYWGPYLKSLGFSASDIGALIALFLATKIVAPNIWGWIADRSGRCMGMVRLASVLTVIAFAGVFFTVDFWWLALIMASFSFFWNASLPQLEATTMNYLGTDAARYGRVRLWGSIGFIVTVWALGRALDHYSPGLVRPVVLALMAGILLSSLLIPERVCQLRHEHHDPLASIFRRPEVVAFLLTCLLMQASHAPYYTFYTIFLRDHGYSNGLIGFLWAFGVICEIGVFLAMHRLLVRLSLRTMLLASFALAVVRWLMIGFLPENLTALVAAQSLHAATFGTFHAAAVHMVHRFFRGRHQHRGQALYSSMSFGVGGALGSFYSGYSWMWFGAEPTFLVAAALAATAFLVTWFFIRTP